jgi:hypothetical protein
MGFDLALKPSVALPCLDFFVKNGGIETWNFSE